VSRVLVTGASGFVGRWALRALRARGHDVHAMTRKARPEGDGIVWHAADVLDGPSARRVIEDVHAERLLHLAWVTEHGAYWESPENPRWVDATKELIARFGEVGGARVVCAGTCAEYEWNNPDLSRSDCHESTTATVPRTLYGTSKLAVNAWLATRRSPSWASGRIFFTYGEGEDSRRLVPSVILALLRGDRARTGPGGLVRDFMHISDVGAAFATLVESDVRGAVNVASGAGLTLAEVVTAIAKIVGRLDAVDLGALAGK
jgi:nucleoside-diphosphate-sugar epimerase